MATTDYPPAAYDAGLPPELRATYTKLRNGDWGIRIPGGARTGDPVAVYKRSGDSTVLTVGLVLWTGNDRNTGMLVSVATIANRGTYLRPAAPAAPTQPRTQSTGSSRKPSNRRATRIPTIAAESAQEPPDGFRGVLGGRLKCTNHALAPEPRATVEADKERADAERSLGLDEPLF